MSLDSPSGPQGFRSDILSRQLEPYTVLLRDRETTATIYPISSPNQLPLGLLAFLCDEFNMEVDRGDTFPFFEPLHVDAFQNYWFGSFAGVMLLGDSPRIENRDHWEKECLGTFYIKPNYPGRCGHICSGEFLVNAGIRGKGIGRTLTECYLNWAPKLSYTYSMFNLVFETNVAARRIWESLGFKRIGRLKGAGILKGMENAVDALIYGRDIVDATEDIGELRFDKIRYYLETGRYPPHSDRSEKSRLRSSASHYRLQDGKLLLKDREVVADTDRQMQIATEIHMEFHHGINKTTAQITEKYHWVRIKDTVGAVIRRCPSCRESHTRVPPPPAKRSRKDLTPGRVGVGASIQDSIHPDDLQNELLKFDTADGIMAIPRLQRQYGYRPEYQNQEDIPVDPQVESAFEDHVQSGEEIAIARALIQANGGSGHRNIF